jgi:hypothetical protein
MGGLPEMRSMLADPTTNSTSLGVGYVASRVLPDRSGRGSAGLTVWDQRTSPETPE